VPWPDPPLFPNEPDPDYDNPMGPDRQDTLDSLGALGLGHVASLNSQKSNRRRNTLGFAPEGGRPKSRKRRRA
jgi:hypothetical protein